jgi:ribosome-associated toxin RatA of RatAB toxin-antitoxin module
MSEQTQSSIAIAAPAPDVMAVIADIEAYPEWNDEVKRVEVLSVYDDADERPAEVRFVLDAGAIKDDYTLEYEWEGDALVRWSLVGEAQVLKRMDGAYELSDNGDGTTSVTYQLAVDVKFPMIGLMKRKAEKVIIDRALKGLKKRVES